MASTSKKIMLKSSDRETFVVEEVVAVESQTIKHMIEDDCADNVITLPNVTSKILSKVIEYCKKHVEAAADKEKTVEEEMKMWGAEFLQVYQNSPFDSILKLHISRCVGLLEEEMKNCDAEFVKVDQNTLFNLIVKWRKRWVGLLAVEEKMKNWDAKFKLHISRCVGLLEEEMKNCDAEFVKVDQNTLFDLIVKWRISRCIELLTVEEEMKNWDAEFVKVDQNTLFDLIVAANYLNIKGLLDLTCQTVADTIKGKTPEGIRTTFNIKNNVTPEEEEEVRREKQWAFE